MRGAAGFDGVGHGKCMYKILDVLLTVFRGAVLDTHSFPSRFAAVEFTRSLVAAAQK